MSGYGKIERLERVPEVLDHPVVVQEKIDGSQFAFGWVDGDLHIASRGGPVDMNNVQSLFSGAVDTVLANASAIPDGYMFYGEAVQSPRHNKITYGRVPRGHIVLFDARMEGVLLDVRQVLEMVADDMGVEVVPELHRGLATKMDITQLAGRESFLGGRCEGVVVKAYPHVDKYGHPLRAKFVNESFRETRIPKKDISRSTIDDIAKDYCTPARWEKALQRLRELGKHTGTLRDIGAIVGLTQQDLFEECGQELRDRLFAANKKAIGKAAVEGLADWYMSLPREEP